MDPESVANAEEYRRDLYRKATDAAIAESREIQSEVLILEARVISLQVRDASLKTLVHSLGELLPVSPGIAAPYTPAHMPAHTVVIG
jgi:vacuolar-type H+-ATPase subunit E/Vma4